MRCHTTMRVHAGTTAVIIAVTIRSARRCGVGPPSSSTCAGPVAQPKRVRRCGRVVAAEAAVQPMTSSSRPTTTPWRLPLQQRSNSSSGWPGPLPDAGGHGARSLADRAPRWSSSSNTRRPNSAELEAQRRSEARCSPTPCRSWPAAATRSGSGSAARGGPAGQLRCAVPGGGPAAAGSAAGRHGTPRVDFLEQSGVTRGGADRAGRPDVVVHLPTVGASSSTPRRPSTATSARPTATTTRHNFRCWPRTPRPSAHTPAALSKRDYDSWSPARSTWWSCSSPGDAYLAAASNAQPSLVEARGPGCGAGLPINVARLPCVGSPSAGTERQVAEQAEEIARTGRELHERLSVFAGHLDKVGGSAQPLSTRSTAAVGSLEARALPQARR